MEIPVFYPQNPNYEAKTGFCDSKTGVFDPNLFPNYFKEIIASLKNTNISEKFLNFDNQTTPKLAKTKSSENSV